MSSTISISFQENFVMTRAYPDREKYPACLLINSEVNKPLTRQGLTNILNTRIVTDAKGNEHELTYRQAISLRKNMKKIGMKPKKIGLAYKIILEHSYAKTSQAHLCQDMTEIQKWLYHYTSLGYTEKETVRDKENHIVTLFRNYPVNTSGVPEK